MTSLSRRSFVFASSGAAIGSFISPGLTSAEEVQTPAETASQSGMFTGQLRPLKHQSIPGFLSAAQIAPHHTAHYGGALRGYLAADTRLEQNVKSGEPIDAAAFGTLKRAIVSRGNSVILHEMYFDGMTPRAPAPAAELRAAIEQRFGSLDKWTADFVASANEAAGWAMLVRHPVSGKLYNVVSDEHAMGILWMATPLVVIDTYEHAFYIDYQNRKAEYVEKFIAHIDWNEANRRWRLRG